MLKRYAIWDKNSFIITPIGEVLSPNQWIERYPVAGLPSITVICGAGEINGSFFGTLGQMIQMCEAQGADFSNCVTDEEKLEVIEAFEDSMNESASVISDQTRIADALEDLAVLSMPDVEE